MKLISDRVNYARKYIDAGFTLMPLNGKVPINRAWTSLTYSPDQNPADYEHQNFGVVLTDEDLVIDIDPRNFEEHDNPIERLTKNIQAPLVSFTVQTGGGGLHIYMKKPKDVNIKRTLAHYQGVEFKSKGQQVVGAGSVHPDSGKEYIPVSGDITEIKDAPKELLNLLRVDIVTEDIGITKYVDDEQTCNRFSEYLVTQAELAIQGAHGDTVTFRTACRGRDFGLTPDKTYELMSKLWNPSCQPPWEERELRKKVQNAYIYNGDVAGKKHPNNDFSVIAEPSSETDRLKIKWDVASSGQLKKTLSNVVNFFLLPDSELKEMFVYNEFTNDIEFKRPAPWHKGRMPASKTWGDSDAVQCKYYLSSLKHFDISTTLVHEAALVLAKLHGYHPVKNYLQNLQWDGLERLDRWLIDYAGVEDNAYTRTIGRKTLVAAVSRIFDPGCKFDYMLVFEGRQGIYKSTLCSILGQSWYGDIILNTHDKDTIDALRGKWIVEVSEMECTRRADAQALKAFISRQCDRVRLAYARQSDDYPRQCIFIGTINPEAMGYLRDNTGNRRFWPVKCERGINIKKLKNDIHQLWAEAVCNYKLGESLYITDKDVMKRANQEVAERKEDDPWLDQIRDWLDHPDSEGQIRDVVTLKQIYIECLGISAGQISRAHQARVANVLSLDLGWIKGVYRDKDKERVIRGFKRPKFELEKFVQKPE